MPYSEGSCWLLHVPSLMNGVVHPQQAPTTTKLNTVPVDIKTPTRRYTANPKHDTGLFVFLFYVVTLNQISVRPMVTGKYSWATTARRKRQERRKTTGSKEGDGTSNMNNLQCVQCNDRAPSTACFFAHGMYKMRRPGTVYC